MSDFIGTKCLVCEEEFKKGDDIVVCPECGTPYHRECYNKNGECINTELHDSQKSWKEKLEEEKANMPVKCPKCGVNNSSKNTFCTDCGALLKEEMVANVNQPEFIINFEDATLGMNPKEQFEDVTLEEISDFVRSNKLYYLPLFKRIKDSGMKMSINFVSFLFPEFYFGSRKMYLWAIISVIIKSLLAVPAYIEYMAGEDFAIEFCKRIIEMRGFGAISTIAVVGGYVFRIFMCCFSNWLYYKFVINKIKALRKQYSHYEQYRHHVRTSGGVSIGGMVLVCSIYLMVALIIVILLSFFTAIF